MARALALGAKLKPEDNEIGETMRRNFNEEEGMRGSSRTAVQHHGTERTPHTEIFVMIITQRHRARVRMRCILGAVAHNGPYLDLEHLYSDSERDSAIASKENEYEDRSELTFKSTFIIMALEGMWGHILGLDSHEVEHKLEPISRTRILTQTAMKSMWFHGQRALYGIIPRFNCKMAELLVTYYICWTWNWGSVTAPTQGGGVQVFFFGGRFQLDIQFGKKKPITTS
ncbi:hypothetical protein K438DRAFT_1762265 [Mycena galopus ATCC 62051]|nr:hypothetical protein K438DRAFT_1762265 [Mycena galopus ATCC 62051]